MTSCTRCWLSASQWWVSGQQKGFRILGIHRAIRQEEVQDWMNWWQVACKDPPRLIIRPHHLTSTKGNTHKTFLRSSLLGNSARWPAIPRKCNQSVFTELKIVNSSLSWKELTRIHRLSRERGTDAYPLTCESRKHTYETISYIEKLDLTHSG